MSFLTIPDTSKPDTEYPPTNPAIAFPYLLDPFQQLAVTAIHANKNILVTAKTCSGKTTVAEYQIAYSMKKHQRVFYTTPIKSLSNQKFHDLKRLFPDNSVGILTGDIKFNPDADIIVMTTEIVRNLLFKANTQTATLGLSGAINLNNLGAVIFDEVHYINDPERGHVWEETLILMPPQIRLILLSATIDSPELFADWLGKAKQHPIVLLKTSHRIVPLIHGIYDPTSSPLPLKPLKDGDEAPFQPNTYQAWIKAKQQHLLSADKWKDQVKNAQRQGESSAGSESKVKVKSFTHTMNEALDQLREKQLLPALFFVFSRKECEKYADQLTQTLLETSEQASVKHLISFHLHPYMKTLEHLPQYHQITKYLQRGIAFHHSGLLPILKEIVEILFSRGFVKVLFCTETFAVGLNMPARTVVFLDLKKPSGNGNGFRPLRPDEYIQMAGRAGRRGKDTQGVVIYLPAKQPVELDEIRQSMAGTLVPLESRLQFHYDFMLKAIHAAGALSPNGPKDAVPPLWTTLIDTSYWTAQQQTAKKAAEAEIKALQEQQSSLPLTQQDREELVHHATLADAVKSATNAAKRKAQAALDQWKDRHAGPKWTSAKTLYDQHTRLQASIDKLNTTIEAMETQVKSRIDPLIKALIAHGAIHPLFETQNTPTLTEFGLAATEVNEANPLLLAKLYLSGQLKSASMPEIVGVLGAFLVDREAEDKTQHPTTLPSPITKTMKDALMAIDSWGQQGATIDKQANIESPETYWSLTTLWVQVGHEWVSSYATNPEGVSSYATNPEGVSSYATNPEGAEAAHLASKYELYEGNLMKGLLKLANIVNEWIAIATLKSDVDMLETMKDAQSALIRDIVQPESLYLRLS
jgi:superfamily II RNA helicase